MLFKKEDLLISLANINFVIIKEKRNSTNFLFGNFVKSKYAFHIFLHDGDQISFDFSTKNLEKAIEFQKAILFMKTKYQSVN